MCLNLPGGCCLTVRPIAEYSDALSESSADFWLIILTVVSESSDVCFMMSLLIYSCCSAELSDVFCFF